jgi:RNA polymerase sigma-70 factor (ECF subfamily)
MQQPEVEQFLPDAQLASAETEESVRVALADLSGEQLKVVTLSFFENKPHPEIAEALGIPLGTVKSRLRLAMKRLRSLLEDSQ